MARAFTRQLGPNQPGVQLNPIKDRTGNGLLGFSDQTAAIVGRFTRGPIDRAFRVHRGNIRQFLGKGASITQSALNEAYVHVYEALQRGAREVIVSRLSVAASANLWSVFTSAAASTFATSAAPTGSYSFAVKHLGCPNDGYTIKVHADAKSVAGTPTANDVITVRIIDADGIESFVVRGSLTAGSTDEYGQSNYLPDVSSLLTDMLEWSIPGTPTLVGTAHDAYGKDASGVDKQVTSALLSPFTEGGTGYVTADYDRAIAFLRDGQHDFGYIMSGGTRAVPLLTKLNDLAFETNRQFIFDIDGTLSVAGAIAFVNSLGIGSLGRDHYPQAYWAPLKSLDPVNNNIVHLGTSGAQVGMRCARNGQVNGYGLSNKHVNIAGINGILVRPNVSQTVTLSEQDPQDLAAAKINPVIFQRFSGGNFPVFADSLTCAATLLSYRKLIAVAETSSDIDERVARKARELLQTPMTDAVKAMNDYLETLFSQAKATGWLTETTDIPAYEYAVAPAVNSPADTMHIQYWLHFTGTLRQAHIQLTIR